MWSSMKKRVLFIVPSMEIGGAERSLLGLLEAIDPSKIDVSLMIYRHEGELMKDIPPYVNVLPEMSQYRTFDVPVTKLIKERKLLFVAARILSVIATKIHSRITGERAGVWMSVQYITRFLQPLLPQIPGEYDLGIMFLGVGDTLLNKVYAEKKVAWCHTDYSTLGPSKRMDVQTYRKMDNIVMVSGECKYAFDQTYPQFKMKSIVVENILSTTYLQCQSLDEIGCEMSGSGWKVLSIGRFCEAKNFENVPEICKLIRAQGLDVTWYLIGYGGDESLIRQKIQEHGMEEHVIVLGKKSNPYPYIKACDVYVQPSRYEGKCVAVREAQMLGKPVIITNYATSASQLENGVDGVIVPMENEACAKGIADVLCNRELMEKLTETCKKRDYSNSQEVEKLYRLMSE